MVVLSTALDQASPFVLRAIIDHFDKGGELTGIYKFLGIWIGLSLISGVMLYYQRLIIISISRKAEFAIRQDAFQKLQQQPRTFFDDYSTGDIMARMTNDMDHFRELIGPALLHSFRMVLLLIYTAASMLYLSWQLAILGLAMSLLLPFFSMRFLKYIYTTSAQKQKSLAELNGFVQETFTAISVVKSFGKEQTFLNLFSRNSENLRDSSKKVAVSVSGVWPIISLVSGVGICIVIFTGAWMVTKNQISVGDLSASVFFLIRVHFPLVGLGWVVSLVQRGRASLDRIWQLFEKMSEVQEIGTVDLSKEKFENLEVSLKEFSYPGTTLAVLENLNFRLEKGKSLGIVGETGCGKTTLLRLLIRMYSAAPGAIRINGIPAEDIKGSSLYQLFSLAPQDGFLFSESIRSNIEIGRQISSTLTVEQAAEMAGLSRDLQRDIPGGLEALLGEKGINLSGGQRQRVGLARALISGAPVLILDDTLSAVDTETEHLILNNLREHFKNLTSIIVSHRYSSVIECDEILYLQDGAILERGNHQALMALNGHYAKTYSNQMLESALERS